MSATYCSMTRFSHLTTPKTKSPTTLQLFPAILSTPSSIYCNRCSTSLRERAARWGMSTWRWLCSILSFLTCMRGPKTWTNFGWTTPFSTTQSQCRCRRWAINGLNITQSSTTMMANLNWLSLIFKPWPPTQISSKNSKRYTTARKTRTRIITILRTCYRQLSTCWTSRNSSRLSSRFWVREGLILRHLCTRRGTTLVPQAKF